MSDITETIAEAMTVAETAGCVVVRSTPLTLLLDFDGHGVETYVRLRSTLQTMWGIAQEMHWPSRGGKPGHYHMVVHIERELPAASRVALQAALGSDEKRELLAVRRLQLGVDEPSLLFRPKDAVVTQGHPVVSWHEHASPAEALI